MSDSDFHIVGYIALQISHLLGKMTFSLRVYETLRFEVGMYACERDDIYIVLFGSPVDSL